MDPYIRVYDRAGNYCASELSDKVKVLQSLREYCETGIDRLIALNSIAGGDTVMRVSDVTSVVDMGPEIIRVSAKQDAEEQRIFEEAKEEDEPSWK